MTGALHGGSGWQTVLADLSLILFMVCVSALSMARAMQYARLKVGIITLTSGKLRLL